LDCCLTTDVYLVRARHVKGRGTGPSRCPRDAGCVWSDITLERSQTPLSRFPGYRPGSVPQYARYHAEVDFLDELEAIWGRRWGAQGIGRLRTVAMSTPTEVETLELYDEDPAFFVYDGVLPDLELMREQHAGLAETYRQLGIEVLEFAYPETPRSAYGTMKRAVSAAAGFVINGGAVIAREATPYWRGRSRYVSQYLQSIGCPILMTVHGKGVCEGGAFTRMADDFIIGMLSTDANQDGIDQVRPVLERAGYRLWVARSPGPLYDFHPEVLQDAGVETIEVAYDEVLRYGGGIRCTTMQLVRDPGPRVFA
jgi:N-dimethylarginine dimethylaminohydrolase